ncbi:aldolase/citrate lyase family protein [Variovorax robiniae]|uniref:Aldolase/citrate lyase family protein n=1 Tax=Variovorax robiniae TaxID=1836199 RepID=A0ABU8XES6_9BURK
MLELLQITNDPALARRCDAIGGFRLFVDLEQHGKAQRQAGRNTFISSHVLADIAPVKSVLTHSRLMVRVNPLHGRSAEEIDAVIACGADVLMLPMFNSADTLRQFCDLVRGRVPVSALLETAGALASIEEWASTPGLQEIYVGLNDLHISLGLRFVFEPLALGYVEQIAAVAKRRGLDFGFGGIARLAEGLLPGRDVLAEHVRLGSNAVILSRTFYASESTVSLEQEVAALREAETRLASRDNDQAARESQAIRESVVTIAASLRDRDRQQEFHS